MRAAILRLRSDPQASAMLAGALTRNNGALVRSNIGRQPTNGEFYIAHFLGADGASKLINGASTRPQVRAAAMFPAAAAANHSIFYDGSGRARSLGEVYTKLTRLFDSARTSPDTAGMTQTFAKASESLQPPPAVRPTFQSMFSDRVNQPLAQTVNNLWNAPSLGTPTPGQAVQVFDLFTDPRPNERKLSGNKA